MGPLSNGTLHPSCVRLIASIALPVLLGGCYSTVAFTVPAPVLSDPMTLDYRGESIQLARPELQGDSVLLGWAYAVPARKGIVQYHGGDSLRLRLPLRGADRRLKRGSTVAIVAGAAVFVAALVTNPFFTGDCWGCPGKRQ